MVRTILTGKDEALRMRCQEITVVDEEVRHQLDEMMETLAATENGAALAANQVGIMRRLIVIDYLDYRLKLVNPKIVSSGGSQECIEGCLSFPGAVGKTLRPRTVTVEALDENGRKRVLKASGEMAKCFCHEIDHLDGEVFVDKVTEWIEPETEL
jgi:peptide deformylase